MFMCELCVCLYFGLRFTRPRNSDHSVIHWIKSHLINKPKRRADRWSMWEREGEHCEAFYLAVLNHTSNTFKFKRVTVRTNNKCVAYCVLLYYNKNAFAFGNAIFDFSLSIVCVLLNLDWGQLGSTRREFSSTTMKAAAAAAKQCSKQYQFQTAIIRYLWIWLLLLLHIIFACVSSSDGRMKWSAR